MSFLDCIAGHLKSRLITETQADALENQYLDLVAKYTTTMGDARAAENAAGKLIEIKANQMAAKKASDLLAWKSQQNVVAHIGERHMEAVASYGKLSKARKKLLDWSGGKPSISDTVRDFLDTVGSAQEHQINLLMHPLVDLIRKKPKYFENENFNAFMKDAVGHMMGKSASTAEAREIGEALRKTFDLAHKRYRQMGGVIGKLANYFPQSHNAQKLQTLVGELGEKAAYMQWRDFILPRLDLTRMIDEETGLPFTPKKLEAVMQANFEVLRTDGLSKIHSMAAQGKQLAGHGGDLNLRRDQSRFYHFRDADAWFEYNDKFGNGTEALYDTVISHIGTMGRDLGTMQKMGPKPASTMRNLQLHMAGDTPQSQKWTTANYEAITGGLSAGTQVPHWYRAHNAFRNLQRAAFLGSAPISALGDPFFVKMMSRRFGLPGFSVVEQIKQIREAGGIDTHSIAQFLTATDMMMGSSMTRFGEDPVSMGSRILGKAETGTLKAAEAVHRASGLNYWTAVQETAAAMGTEASTFHARNSIWANLDPRHRDALNLYGIDEKQWEIIRSAEPKVVGRHGAQYIGAYEVAALGDSREIRQAAANYGSFVKGATDVAINKPSARVRGIQSGFGQKEGTILRAYFGSVTQFKGFGFSVMFNHTMPMVHRAVKGEAGGMKDLALFAVMMAPIGAMAIQLRELAKGNTPRDMEDHRFWMAAMAQGGGWGPLGDFFFAEHGRFGRSPLVDMALGTTGGAIDDVRRITLGNFDRALEDRSYNHFENMLRDAYKMTTNYVPGQSLWYSRNFYEALADLPLQWLDSDYYDKREARIEYQREHFGNEPYRTPGEFLP